jgi:DNA repair exonuclease SbcCD nuclease subunit
MSKQLFKTAACFTDIHLGLKSNSKVHLDDCDRYIDWFIGEAKARSAETCIFLGDWHHHRATINVYTLTETLRQLKKLNDAFEKVYFITGNHDLYFKDQRSVNSVEYARDLSNFVMVDQPLVQDDVAIIPWLVGDEYKKVIKYKVKYLFGHLELPYFKMNAMVEMPDHGGLSATQLSEPDYVFSGHFHKRQHKGNVHYIGNAFPHNYADAGDTDRGAMFLTWGQEPVYVNWTECPKYQVFTLKDLLDNHETLLDKYTHARVKLDISISYEEATFIKENFVNLYGVRELQLIPVKEEEQYDGAEIKFESVDQIVLQQLDTLESNTIDKSILISIYNELEI